MSTQLDNPVWHSLTRYHRDLAVGSELALRYPPDVGPFLGMPDEPGEKNWAAARELATEHGAAIVHSDLELPPGWGEQLNFDVIQMIAPEPIGAEDPRVVPLGLENAAELQALVDEAKPGPFGPQTVLLGGYLGIRVDGELAAMAGQRMRVDGWTEVSAVSTSPRHRGQGLATAVLRAVAAQIEARGDHVFLHVLASNPARGLYERLGFQERRHISIRGVAYSPHGVA